MAYDLELVRKSGGVKSVAGSLRLTVAALLGDDDGADSSAPPGTSFSRSE